MSNERDTIDVDGSLRSQVPEPPRGARRLRWYGPGLLWMISSVGSGSVLFTPRVGSRYGYVLLWVVLIIVFFMWVMIREVGRYTVVSGKTILDGYRTLPGPRNWAIWFILIPQIVSGIVLITGIAALVGSVLMIALPGSQLLYAVGMILVSGVLVITGRYEKVEHVSSILAGMLVAVALVSAIVVFPALGPLAAGAVPGLPDQVDLYFILPWVGFILAGAAGIMWYSYWVAARGYGGRVGSQDHGQDEDQAGQAGTAGQPGDGTAGAGELDVEELTRRARGWLRVMSTTALIGVVGGMLVILSFLILGAELLGPEGIVPEGVRVAEDLTKLFSEVWGTAGRWILLVGIFVALWGTIIADQDGWGRMYADATFMLLPAKGQRERHGLLGWVLASHERLRDIYIVALLVVLPIGILLVMRKPVDILSVGGIVTAVHTPVVVFLTLYLNRKALPHDLRPGAFITTAMCASGLFYGAFCVAYFYNLIAR